VYSDYDFCYVCVTHRDLADIVNETRYQTLQRRNTCHLPLLGRIACRTTYAAYCCRQSSMVCLSVRRLVSRSVRPSVTILSPAKAAEAITMSFGMLSRVGPRNHVLDGLHNGATGEYLNCPYAAAMRLYVKLL